jgi:hypothetical protein
MSDPGSPESEWFARTAIRRSLAPRCYQVTYSAAFTADAGRVTECTTWIYWPQGGKQAQKHPDF